MEVFENWLATTGLSLLNLVLRVVITAAIGILIIRFVTKILDKILEKSKLDKAAFSLIKTLARTVMIVLLALILASSVGIDVTGIVALASVLTLAVSLALQNMLANVIGGFTLLYTHPFGAGDFVEIAGQSGTVQEVGIAYTRLTTPDNKLVSIPNSAVVAAEIVNYTVLGTRRVEIKVSASYDAPAKKVIDALVSCTQGQPVLETPEKPYAVLVAYEESTIQYALRYWVNGEDYWSTCFAIQENIKTVFDENGVEMSYPHLNVHLDK